MLVGLEAFLGSFEKERQNGKFYDNARDNEYNFDYVNQKINIYGIAIKYGVVLSVNKKIFINFSNGLGFRARTLTHTSVTNLRSRPLGNQDKEWRFAYKDMEGTKHTPHASLELSLGYKLF